ncbi:MAG: type II toxin-antitoxin system HipA family toxin [Gammaproteobacteria bacterium]|nr:type II toxin-antitoxin system HipA family toxin [Gammaproteobacteria bacterium]
MMFNLEHENHRYKVYLNTPELGVQHCGTFQIREKGAQVKGISFKYNRDYIEQPKAFPIDPALLRLHSDERLLIDAEVAPGFLDDYLPDEWGRKVLTNFYSRKERKSFDANKISDMLSVLGSSRIGALSIVPYDQEEPPEYIGGAGGEKLEQAELAAQQLDTGDFESLTFDDASLVFLSSHGTGVGGARPKALINDNGIEYLVKFNRSTDPYNMARTEHACLLMAKALGICNARSHVRTSINNRELLMQERFDVVNGSRRHMITINALLKEPITQRDSGLTFTYDKIADLLAQYSSQIDEDLEQLVTQMLFNRAIHNTDDHERNFSLWHNGEGYSLTPSYDMVPTLDTGSYHAASFGYSAFPPKPSELSLQPIKIFGLSKTEVKAISEKVVSTVNNWRAYAEQAGLDEENSSKVERVFCA